MILKCASSGRCGGCQYTDIPYEDQLKQKQEYIRKLFPGCKVNPVMGMENPLHYRHKVYATFGIDENGRIAAGMFEENSHDLIFEHDCMIQNETANRVIASLCRAAEKYRIEPYDEDTGRGVLRHAYVRVGAHSGDVLLTIVIGSKQLPASSSIVKDLIKENPQIRTIALNFNSRHTSMVLGSREVLLYGDGHITDKIGSLSFRISTRSFYQVNPVQAERLYNTALDMAKLKKTDQAVDACCGIGTISLLAAQRCGGVIGVETVKEAVKDAIYNARKNHVSNAWFYAMDAEEFFMNLEGTPDCVIADPPRAGLSENTLNAIAASGCQNIVYIACDPRTQARDCRILKEKGYRIREIQPVDMFPFTKHVESIVKLTRAGK